ncbi:MAG: hypothetical protein AABX05_03970 [Nanoarchaeota archaeon]
MQRYNLLLCEEGSLEGLCILKTEAYVARIQQEPGMPHENLGDFYSEVPCEELADKIYQLLQEADLRLVDNLVITDALSFEPDRCDNSKDYIVKEEHGTRLYVSPDDLQKFAEKGVIAERVYFLASEKFLPRLFSDYKEGSLQKKWKEVEDIFKAYEALQKAGEEAKKLSAQLKAEATADKEKIEKSMDKKKLN